MAKFESCFKKVIEIEGGWQLTNTTGDRGGQTYAGISRTKNPAWPGWVKIDQREFDDDLKAMVKDFYREEFWNKIQGDVIESQSVAFNLFEYGVNVGIGTAIRMCQRIIKVKVDGVFGKKTLKALNTYVTDAKDEKNFVLEFSLMKIFRYVAMALSDPRREHDLLVSNQKFICGWINRVKAGLAYWGIRYP